MLLSTDRLDVPTRWSATDLEAYFALNTDPEVMAHLGGPMTREAITAQEWVAARP